MCLLTALFSELGAQGIQLTLAGGPIAPGATVSVPFYIANQGSSTGGVQWALSYSPSDFTSVSFSIGAAADSAGKILTCNSAPGQSNCVVWGLNPNVVSDGILAVVNLTASSTISGTATPSNVIAASTDGSALAATVTPPVSNISCSPSTVVVPGSAACTVALSGAAPDGGVSVSLGYTTDPSVSVSLPTSVIIPPGSATAGFTVQIDSAGANSTVQVTGNQNGSTANFSLQVQTIVVTVSPSAVTLNALGKQQFTAAVSNTTNPAVSWSIDPAVGSISSTGVYTPPLLILSTQTVTVIATSAADPTKNGTATVTLVPLTGVP